MKNPLVNITQALDKMAEFAGLTEEQKKAYRNNIQLGLIANLLADGSEIVPQGIINQLKTAVVVKEKDEARITAGLTAYFEAMGQTEAGKKIFQKRIDELVRQMIDSMLDRLNEQQKAEIEQILKQA